MPIGKEIEVLTVSGETRNHPTVLVKKIAAAIVNDRPSISGEKPEFKAILGKMPSVGLVKRCP